jgi:topoisomerase-4 subunit A
MLDVTQVVGSDPVTIILSEKGWIRTAKGSEIDPETLAYRSGDRFFMAVAGRSNQPTHVLDSSGRCYTLATHELPSARTQGEPLTGRLNPPPGAVFKGVMTGAEDDCWLLASEAGYGFLVRLKALITRQGRLLIVACTDVPALARGKGNKLIQMMAADLAGGQDKLLHATGVPEGASLKLYAGQRTFTLKPDDWAAYRGTRGTRGNLLPRGLQRVERVEVLVVSADNPA